MKTLTQHIKANKLPLISLNEKLIINKNYSSNNAVDYLDSNIDEFYLIRLRPDSWTDNYFIYIDIITNPFIELVVDKPNKKIYELSGKFLLCDARYTRAQFNPDSHNFLFRWNTAFEDRYDLLLHPFYASEFKKFIESFVKNYDVTYLVDEIFNMFNLDYDNIPNELKNKEYMISDMFDDIRFSILKKHLRNK